MAEGEGERETKESPASIIRLQDLTDAERERVRLIEGLVREGNRSRYLARQREIAQQLNMTVRNVQRLVRSWERDGVRGLVRGVRSDVGEHRLSEAWEAYIVETYRKGNRGGRRMSRAQVSVRVEARARELGEIEYPSRSTVYRVLGKEIDRQEVRSRVRSVGWSGEELILRTREGGEIKVERSNQVWQCDHTRVDLLVVDEVGEVLGRPWLTTVVDTHSRCIVGIHLGMGSPSAWVVCLALRHAILPKQYSSSYELQQGWGTYGLPQYLYTDGGKEFNSKHLEQVASELKIVLHQRRYPAEGGIVERPFGTLNSELFATLPGYTGGSVKRRPKQAEASASLTLTQLEKQIVRYIVDRYNQGLDARIGHETRIGRWEAGATMPLSLLGERELDICLMRRDRRRVYRGGYLQFANLSYRGEHLAGYSGEEIIIRYNPRDITTVWVYQQDGKDEQFVARAHAVGLEAETMSYGEAKAIAARLRQLGKAITNESMLYEVRDRDATVEQLRQARARKRTSSTAKRVAASGEAAALVSRKGEPDKKIPANGAVEEVAAESGVETEEIIAVEDVVVHDYEELKRNYGKRR